MKRARGAGLAAAAAGLFMLAGGFFALRPFLFRETLAIVVLRYGSPDPYASGVLEGVERAVRERESRAGRFRIEVSEAGAGDLQSYVYSEDSGPLRIGERKLEVAAVIDGHLTGWLLDSMVEKGVPTLSAEASSTWERDGLLRDAPLCRVIPDFDRLGAAAAGWAKRLGARRVLLLEEMFDTRSSAVGDAFRKAAAGLGLELANDIRFTSPYDSLPVEVLEARPDVVFLSGERPPFRNAREVIRRLREREFKGEILFADADPASSLLLAPPPFAEECRLVSLLPPPPIEFTRKFGAAPLGAWPGYLAATAALDAVERAGSKDWGAIRRACARNPLFAPNGAPASAVTALYTLKDGAWVFAETME